MKNLVWAFLAWSCCAQHAAAQETVQKAPRLAGLILQLDVALGGDDIYDGETFFTHTDLGEGFTPSVGGFYRFRDYSPFELQAFVGYKTSWLVPVRAGPASGMNRWVFQLLANYHRDNKWYLAGGPVLHASPNYYDDAIDAVDVNFDDSVGAVIEAGWSWVGLQCTFIKYDSPDYGEYDASNCGVRFNFRFGKWRAAP